MGSFPRDVQPRDVHPRPPDHYVCWCGTVVSPGATKGATLYETTGDVHECSYRSPGEHRPGASRSPRRKTKEQVLKAARDTAWAEHNPGPDGTHVPQDSPEPEPKRCESCGAAVDHAGRAQNPDDPNDPYVGGLPLSVVRSAGHSPGPEMPEAVAGWLNRLRIAAGDAESYVGELSERAEKAERERDEARGDRRDADRMRIQAIRERDRVKEENALLHNDVDALERANDRLASQRVEVTEEAVTAASARVLLSRDLAGRVLRAAIPHLALVAKEGGEAESVEEGRAPHPADWARYNEWLASQEPQSDQEGEAHPGAQAPSSSGATASVKGGDRRNDVGESADPESPEGEGRPLTKEEFLLLESRGVIRPSEPPSDPWGELIGWAEDVEDRAFDQLEAGGLTDHERGFHRGQKVFAKRLRNVVGELRRARLSQRTVSEEEWEDIGEEAAIRLMEHQGGPGTPDRFRASLVMSIVAERLGIQITPSEERDDES